MAEVGPDGNVWVIDWYNYIVQHNPTPAGFKTGKGAAYETDLRDKTHGRIYRVVYDEAPSVSRSRTLDRRDAGATGRGAEERQHVLAAARPAAAGRARRNATCVAGLIKLVQDTTRRRDRPERRRRSTPCGRCTGWARSTARTARRPPRSRRR